MSRELRGAIYENASDFHYPYPTTTPVSCPHISFGNPMGSVKEKAYPQQTRGYYTQTQRILNSKKPPCPTRREGGREGGREGEAPRPFVDPFGSGFP
jgi:hypothetical protein